MRKMLLISLLVTILTFSVFGQSASDFNFEVRNGTITITGLFRPGSTREVVIPNRVNNIPVTAIGDRAFINNNLISVTIPNSVTHIGIAAFAQNQLTNITIPNSVITIGHIAFLNNQLINVTIPNSVTSIGEGAFSNNQLSNVTIGNGVTSIGSLAFSNNQLTNVSIPASVQNIEFGPFENNLTLKSINVSSNNPHFNSVDGVLLNKSGTILIEWPAAKSPVAIPNSVTTIGESAFCRIKLTSITIPNTVKVIEDRAFMGNLLTNVVIPNSVTTIGGGAFLNNSITSISIPASVISIDDFAFSKNPLISVTFASNRVELEQYSFSLPREALSSSAITDMLIRGDLTMEQISGENFIDTNMTQVYRRGGAGTYQRNTGSPYWTRQ